MSDARRNGFTGGTRTATRGVRAPTAGGAAAVLWMVAICVGGCSPERPVDPALAPLVRALQRYNIPDASQVLVFSKTSLQRDRISGVTPRAIYFNDRASVAWVPGSHVLEVAVYDDARAISFLTIDTSAGEGADPRSGERCFQCHALPGAGGLQGLLMRSAGPRLSGEAHCCVEDVDDRTPYDRRWGGWYVTGPRLPVNHAGRSRLPAFGRSYLEPGSDVVALLVLGHQVQMTNLIARLGREMRLADHDRRAGRPADASSIQAQVNELVDYMLFLDEAPLPHPIRGVSAFARTFEASAVRDAHGHSLRELDLERRLFRVPCSFMIHSPMFASLPPAARQAVYARLSAVLTGADARDHSRLSRGDREAVVHLLRETIGDLPPDFPRAIS